MNSKPLFFITLFISSFIFFYCSDNKKEEVAKPIKQNQEVNEAIKRHPYYNDVVGDKKSVKFLERNGIYLNHMYTHNEWFKLTEKKTKLAVAGNSELIKTTVVARDENDMNSIYEASMEARTLPRHFEIHYYIKQNITILIECDREYVIVKKAFSGRHNDLNLRNEFHQTNEL